MNLSVLLQEQAIQAAGRSNGVDRQEASLILGINLKATGKLYAYLTESGKVIRQAGGWQGRQVRWFTERTKAKKFGHGKHTAHSPTFVSNSQVYVKPTKNEPKFTICPSGKDQRFTVPADHRGSFMDEWRQLRGQR